MEKDIMEKDIFAYKGMKIHREFYPKDDLVDSYYIYSEISPNENRDENEVTDQEAVNIFDEMFQSQLVADWEDWKYQK